MFWEVSAAGHYDALERINKFLLSIFKFAFASGSRKFDAAFFVASFQPDEVKFFLDRYHRKNSPLKEAIDPLFELCSMRRKAIYEALCHDKTFAHNRTLPFSFQTPHLPEDERQVLEDIFLYFFKNVFDGSGFRLSALPKGIFGCEEFEQGYFGTHTSKVLRNTCPICLQSVTNAPKEHDREHFFPKSSYPALTLHPINLYYSCNGCNTRYKKTKDPIAPLHNNVQTTFIPYVDIVREKVHIDITCDDQVKLRPNDLSDPFIQEKINTLNYLFQLEERWSDLLGGYNEYFYDEFKDSALADIDVMQDEMLQRLQMMKRAQDRRPEEYVKCHYLEWLCASDLEAFHANLIQDDKNSLVV